MNSLLRLFKLTPVACSLLVVNIALFIAMEYVLPRGQQLRLDLGLFYFDSPNFSPYQILTHLFMHGNIAHIFFNMFALFTFGLHLEALWGSKKFAAFYLVTGIGAAVLNQAVQGYELYADLGSWMPFSNFLPPTQGSSLIERTSTIGASGAIFGLLTAFVVIFPNAKLAILFLPIPIAAKYVIPVLMLVELFLGVKQFEFDNIAHFAHLGGALIGFTIVKIWMRGKTIVYRGV